MKISLNWLTDYVDVAMPARQLGELLTHVGLNCDEVAETAGDVVFTLDVTSNRPDWLGHVGVAREVSAATGAAFRPPAVGNPPASGSVKDLTSVRVDSPDLCPRYTARVIRGVKVGPSPSWMVEKLSAVGLRSVNNVVDVTNFVLFEYSQPLHSFDFDKLAGRRIVVRRAQDGETMVSIDGTRCRLDSSMLVIADERNPVAVAGVMGGLDSEVAGSTVNVLIESAQFDPLCIRRTSRKLALMSESNYRFERGVDPVGVDEASRRACRLILELCGGRLADGVCDVWAKTYVPATVALRPERTNAILGMAIPAERQRELLDRLGLSARMAGGRIACTIPPFRRDLVREIDLIEEVARLAGYDGIPVGGRVTHAVLPEGLMQRTRRLVGSTLSAAGFDEAMTFTFVEDRESELFGQPKPLRADALVRKTNNALRSTLVPSLLRACKTNQDAGNADVSLFELSAVFPPGEGGGLPREHVELALASTGDLRALRGAIETVVAAVAPDGALEVRPAEFPGFAAGTAAEASLDGEPVGMFGRVAADARDYYGLEREIVAGRLNFDALLKRAGKVLTYRPIPKFPAVKRDLSLIVDEDVTWSKLLEAVSSVAQPLREAIDYVTTYRGKPIADGRKSVTITLVYRSPDGTLRSEQVDEQVAGVVEAARKSLNAELRT